MGDAGTVRSASVPPCSLQSGVYVTDPTGLLSNRAPQICQSRWEGSRLIPNNRLNGQQSLKLFRDKTRNARQLRDIWLWRGTDTSSLGGGHLIDSCQRIRPRNNKLAEVRLVEHSDAAPRRMHFEPHLQHGTSGAPSVGWLKAPSVGWLKLVRRTAVYSQPIV